MSLSTGRWMERWKVKETLLDGCTHPHTFWQVFFSLSTRDKLGICNIDAFLLLLLLFYPCWLQQLAFVIKKSKHSDLEWWSAIFMYCSAHSVSSMSPPLICLPPCEVYYNVSCYTFYSHSCSNAKCKIASHFLVLLFGTCTKVGME